jgi:hypothetical protein
MKKVEGFRHIKGDVAHVKDNFLPEESFQYLERLRNDVPWQRMKWGRGFLPRLIFRCDQGETWPTSIQELKDRTEETFQCTVRAAWCNFYRSGADYTPPHQDNYGAHVITWSFGGERRFVTDALEDRTKKEYLLADGDVFYFSPGFDAIHRHSIPKTSKTVDPRISIVFFSDQPYCGSHWHTQVDQPFGQGGGIGFHIDYDGTTIVGVRDEQGEPVDIDLFNQFMTEMFAAGAIMRQKLIE